jgi:hypothetical protein
MYCRVHENTCLGDVLKTFIHPTESDPVKRQMLKAYCSTPIENCRILMQEEGLPANIRRSALFIWFCWKYSVVMYFISLPIYGMMACWSRFLLFNWGNCFHFRFHLLDSSKTLCENLQGKEFIEYPTLHVVLPDSAAQYPLTTAG